MAERLSGGSAVLALLRNTLATGAALLALILAFGSVSGAHMNPLVTLVAAARRELPRRDALGYAAAQIAGGLLGVVVANLMFGEALVAASRHVRSGAPQLLSEVVATFGLVSVVFLTARHRPGSTAFAVSAYITAAYWFTASTSFANPAVTLARALTDTFTGIRPADLPGFLVAQVLGAVLAAFFVRALDGAPVSAAAEEPERRAVAHPIRRKRP